MEVTLKKAGTTPEEIARLGELARAIWTEYWVGILPEGQPEYMIEKFQSPRAIAEQIERENYVYFYILCDGETAGYTGLSLKDGYLFLSKLYVSRAFRHRGVATAAFPLIADFARENGRAKIVLTVNKYNANAIAAYKKWRFAVTDAVVSDIGNGYVMDDYVMTYEVGPARA